jgi:1,4-dihydroxy-2-naphthoate octaprenyltransferase
MTTPGWFANADKESPAYKILMKYGETWSPTMYMLCHHCIFLTGHIIAVISYQSMIANYFFAFLWVYFAISNGSNFYTDYFDELKKEGK